MFELIDFSDFEPFNELRLKMGAEKLGHFEMFDPKVHLTGEERSLLENSTMRIEQDQLLCLLDFTLVYKNSRVLLLDDTHYHLAACDRVIKLSDPEITTSLKASDENLSVCRDCLQKLHFNGFDNQKARKERYSEDILRRFTLAQFWRRYDKYPIAVGHEILKPLEKL